MWLSVSSGPMSLYPISGLCGMFAFIQSLCTFARIQPCNSSFASEDKRGNYHIQVYFSSIEHKKLDPTGLWPNGWDLDKIRVWI